MSQDGPPYTPVVVAGDIVAVSGQVGVRPDGTIPDFVEQTEIVFERCRRLLEEAGCSLSDVFKTNVYLTRAEDFGTMNEVYRRLMPEPFPARTTVIVALALPGLLIEIDMLARTSG